MSPRVEMVRYLAELFRDHRVGSIQGGIKAF